MYTSRYVLFFKCSAAAFTCWGHNQTSISTSQEVPLEQKEDAQSAGKPATGAAMLQAPVLSPAKPPMPGVPSDPTTKQIYDDYWLKYRVDSPPDIQPLQVLQSLSLWGETAQQHPEAVNLVVSREDQRALKKDKKSNQKAIEHECDEDGEEKPRPKPKPKAKAKARAAKAKAKAKANAQAKSTPKLKAKPAAEVATEASEKAAAETDLDEPEDNPEATAAITEEACEHPEAGVAAGKGEDGLRAKKRKTSQSAQSFARRTCPKTEKPAGQWHAIRDTFNSIIRPRVDWPSTHEDISECWTTCNCVCKGLCM